MFPKKLVYRCFPLIVIALGRILTDMHAAYCGFASTDSKTTLQLQPVRHGVQHTVQAVPGGWGTILLIVDSEIVISTHVLLPDTGSSLGQSVRQLPNGYVQQAALNSDRIVAVSDSGKLYSVALPEVQCQSARQAVVPLSESALDCWHPLETLRQRVLEIAVGEQHSAASTEDGTVYTWGRNDNCQLGRLLPASNDHDDMPTPVAGPGASGFTDAEAGPESIGMLNSHSQQMRQIACGARHSCSISCKGQVFCWGWDLHGQCGQGRSTVTVDQPQLVKALGGLQVVGIAAGLAHTVACTDSGAVFAWGWNSDGQLGLGDDRNRSQPELVAAAMLEDVDVNKVCCGARHTAVRSSQGELFAWGWNKYGQLGLGDTTNRLLPQQMLTNASVSNVECGWWHTVVVYDTAKL